MDSIIAGIEAESLSDADLHQMTGIKVLTYADLSNYNSLQDVLGEEKACILIFRVTESYGHWVCLLQHDEKTVEFFDSLGYYPDTELAKTTNKRKRQELGQDFARLTQMINASPFRVIYNKYKLQQNAKAINTCGERLFRYVF